MQNRAKATEVYPEKLCRAICQGLKEEVERRKSHYDKITENLLASVTDQGKGCKYVDDLTGEPLDPKLVMEAREKEMAYIRQMRVYQKVPLAEWFVVTGRKPIDLR